MAAVLACGPEAVLSHSSAAALWGIRPPSDGPIEVSVPARVERRRPGVLVHRRARFSSDELCERAGIPVTAPVYTLIDIARRLDDDQIEVAINACDRLDLADPDGLRAAAGSLRFRPGAALLCAVLDRRTFTLTDSALESRFSRLARDAGLPRPETGDYVNGFKVDFWWPQLGLVVETDGLRYHRTPAQQARDRLRDQAHTAAGLTCLRFTHAQVQFEPGHVKATLRAVADPLKDSVAHRLPKPSFRRVGG